MKNWTLTFSFNNNIFQQIDGVLMGSTLWPVLASIFLSEFEKVVVYGLLLCSALCSFTVDTLMTPSC